MIANVATARPAFTEQRPHGAVHAGAGRRSSPQPDQAEQRPPSADEDRAGRQRRHQDEAGAEGGGDAAERADAGQLADHAAGVAHVAELQLDHHRGDRRQQRGRDEHGERGEEQDRRWTRCRAAARRPTAPPAASPRSRRPRAGRREPSSRRGSTRSASQPPVQAPYAIAASAIPMTALLVCSVTPRYGPTSRRPTTSSTRTAPLERKTAAAASGVGRRRAANGIGRVP